MQMNDKLQLTQAILNQYGFNFTFSKIREDCFRTQASIVDEF